MARNLYERICQALDFIETPLVLEILDDLANGRAPYSRSDDVAVITSAIDCLRLLGAVRSTPQPVHARSQVVEITPRGRDLLDRLVDIERGTPVGDTESLVTTTARRLPKPDVSTLLVQVATNPGVDGEALPLFA